MAHGSMTTNTQVSGYAYPPYNQYGSQYQQMFSPNTPQPGQSSASHDWQGTGYQQASTPYNHQAYQQNHQPAQPASSLQTPYTHQVYNSPATPASHPFGPTNALLFTPQDTSHRDSVERTPQLNLEQAASPLQYPHSNKFDLEQSKDKTLGEHESEQGTGEDYVDEDDFLKLDLPDLPESTQMFGKQVAVHQGS